MQRVRGGSRRGYAARRDALRKRKLAGPQPSQPATTPHHGLYPLRVRNDGSDRRQTWAEYVAKLRKATRLSRPKFAERLGVDPTTVWRWEVKGQRPESSEVPELIALTFGLDVDDVLTAAGLKPSGDRAPEPPQPPDEEVELILAQKVDEDTKQAMLERLFQLRERDKQRRIEEIQFLVEQARRARGA